MRCIIREETISHTYRPRFIVDSPTRCCQVAPENTACYRQVSIIQDTASKGISRIVRNDTLCNVQDTCVSDTAAFDPRVACDDTLLNMQVTGVEDPTPERRVCCPAIGNDQAIKCRNRWNDHRKDSNVL